jgi:hypothetical protein
LHTKEEQEKYVVLKKNIKKKVYVGTWKSKA